MRRLRKLLVWSAVGGALAAWRQKYVAENERRYGRD